MKKHLSVFSLILALSLCLSFCAPGAGAEEQTPLDGDALYDAVREICPVSSSFWEDSMLHQMKDGKREFSFDSPYGAFRYVLDAYTGEVLEKDEPNLEEVRAQESFVEPLDTDPILDIIYDLCPIDTAFGINRQFSYHKGIWTYSFDSLFGSFFYQVDAFTGEVLEKDEPNLEEVRAQEDFVEPIDSSGALDRIFEECPIERIMAKDITFSMQPEMVWLVTFSSDYGDFLYMVDALTGEITDREEPDVEAIRASGTVKDYLTAEEAIDIIMDICPIGFGEMRDLKTSWRTDKCWTVTFDSDYGGFRYQLDGLTGEILDREEPDVEALIASGAVQKQLDAGEAISEVFKVAPIKRILAWDTNAAKNGDCWIITFDSDFGKFTYTINARTGKIVDQEGPDVEALRASGTVRERRAPDEIKTDILKEYGLKKEDTENPKNWAITRETWGISFDTKDGSWYFEVDAYTGEILDKEIPDGK